MPDWKPFKLDFPLFYAATRLSVSDEADKRDPALFRSMLDKDLFFGKQAWITLNGDTQPTRLLRIVARGDSPHNCRAGVLFLKAQENQLDVEKDLRGVTIRGRGYDVFTMNAHNYFVQFQDYAYVEVLRDRDGRLLPACTFIRR